MNKQVKNLLDSIDLNLMIDTIEYALNGFRSTITLGDCIKQERKSTASAIVATEYTFTRDFAFCLINDFYDYWKDRVKNEDKEVQKCTCDTCGEVVYKKDAIERVWDDTGEYYDLLCQHCYDKGTI